jgi:DNA-binding NtrC family response regulator
MIAVMIQAAELARTELDVLIIGESGVGKEAIAHGIYRLSNRRGAPFVAVNLAAIPETMMESELFGHERGAFTGAIEKTAGHFERADHGVLFLDEIGDLPLRLQPKLLRVLQDKTFHRLGGASSLRSNVRVLAATDKNLVDLVRRGEFEKTLYFRFQVILKVPPLRERRADIGALVLHFLQVFSANHKKNVSGIDTGAMTYLHKHPLPGNVRQLLNGLEWAVVRASNHQRTLTVDDLKPLMADWESWPNPGSQNGSATELDELTLDQIAAMVISRRLERYNGNKSRVARSLGISRETLRVTIKKFGIGNNGSLRSTS